MEAAEEAESNIAAQNNLKLSLHDAVIPDAFEFEFELSKLCVALFDPLPVFCHPRVLTKVDVVVY